MNKITVIVPVYNAEKYIKRCVDSILRQSYTNLEVILVNDGSKDNSEMILCEYTKSDCRVRVITQENKGVAGARNAGLAAATGEFFIYIDADDWIEKNMVERLLSFVNNNVDIVMCDSDNADNIVSIKITKFTETVVWNSQQQLYEFMKHKRLKGMLWNKLIRRSITDGISFNVKTGYGEDAEFLWKVLKKSRNMVVTNEILYHHVIEKTSISHMSFSNHKYSAIPMWESINKEVELRYPELLTLARERLMCATVFSLYECKACGYKEKEQIKHMRSITKKYIWLFLHSENVSNKFKMYAIAVCLGC